jgi:hypothetical protein
MLAIAQACSLSLASPNASIVYKLAVGLMGIRLGFTSYWLPHPERPLLRQRPLLEAGAQIFAVTHLND